MSEIKNAGWVRRLVANKNFVRAAAVYLISLLIGVVGFVVWYFIAHSNAGWYFLTCFPGFGTGVALAFLNNGHKKPVTFKAAASTVTMTLLLAVIVYFLSRGEIFPVFLGWVLSFIGSAIGLWWCKFEAADMDLAQNQKEIIDIFDEHMNKIGEMEMWEAHEKQRWHKNAHIWVTDGQNVLVQLRAPYIKTFPDKWDISSAGHFSIGDTSLQCAMREWQEELGLPWSFGNVKENMVFKWAETPEGHNIREFVYFFFLKGKPDISKAVLQKEEVADLKWLPFNEFKKQIKTDMFCPFGDEYWDVVIHELGKLMD